MPHEWAAWHALAATPPVLPLAPLLEQLPAHRWPSHEDWTRLASTLGIVNGRSTALTFVPPSTPPPSAMEFERRIHEHGEVETRPACWHDAFHAIAWLNFPRAKARINALHVADGLDASPNRRSVLRNVLTLIDEGGLLVAITSAEQERLLRGFRWHELFWEHRDEVRRTMDFTIFGHALYERALDMHHGVTGRSVLIEVSPAYFELDIPERIRHLDERLSGILDDRALLTSPDFLQPVPIKGIPGWAHENADEAYYFDTSQFCTGRRQVQARAAAC